MSYAALAALKAELGKKRKDVVGEAVPENKYMKRGDLEKLAAQKKEEEIKKLKPTPKEEEKVTVKPVAETTEAKKEATQEDTTNEIEPEPPISRKEAIRRLRQRSEPITLFGESDWKRYQRLHHLEEKVPIEYIEGMDNDFAREIRNAEENDDNDEDKKNRKRGVLDDADDFKFNKLSDSQDNAVSEVPNGRTVKDKKEEFILLLLKTMLSHWEQELNDRPDLEKRTAQGKVATATYKQCRKHIKPLLKLLRERGLPKDILDGIFNISCFIQEREYVKANDAYLQMAIGNAPWPMGVTMVGIHERSAREKIFSNQVAHVLNDETQRKYIQAIKRIMTWAQRKYPNDPSKCVG